MSQPESRYERLDAIERALARHHDGLTTGELARLFTVDPETIRRDLLLLEGRGTGFIKRGRRYLLNHRRSLYTIKLSNDQIMALYLAARLLSRHSDEHNPHVVTALEKVADAVRPRSPLLADHIDLAATAVRARPVRPPYLEALEALTQGWSEGRAVWLRYRNAAGVTSARTFAPYFIEPSGIGYACHAIGWDDQRERVITLKIERITEAQVTERYFQVPAAFDPQHVLANAWGVIWRDEGAITVRLQFCAAVARRVRESTWHHSQQIDDLPDGSCLFTVQVGSTLEMKPWIRQWGRDVVVLEPPALRAELAAEARAMVAHYDRLDQAGEVVR